MPATRAVFLRLCAYRPASDSLGTRRCFSCAPPRWLANPLAQPHQRRLQLGVLLQCVQRLVTAVARLLVAAEREVHITPFVVAVDPYSTRPQAARHFMGGGEVGGPDCGGKAGFA